MKQKRDTFIEQSELKNKVEQLEIDFIRCYQIEIVQKYLITPKSFEQFMDML